MDAADSAHVRVLRADLGARLRLMHMQLVHAEEVVRFLSRSEPPTGVIAALNYVRDDVAYLSRRHVDAAATAQSYAELNLLSRRTAALAERCDEALRASRQHFARSAYTTRSIEVSAQLGHSQRSPHSESVDAFVNAATGTTPSVDLWHIMIGINEIVGVGLSAVYAWDFVDELVRMLVYIAQQRVLEDGVTPAFILYTEPVTGSTTTGLAQRLIRARNRAYHAAVAYLRSLGYTVLLVEANDEAYNA